MLFKEQIDKREEQEQQHLHEAIERLVDQTGLQGQAKRKSRSRGHAIKRIIEALGITEEIEIDEEETFLSLDEQLEKVLFPRGILLRRVELKGTWWQSAVGPLLGKDKQGHYVAFLPQRFSQGYTYLNAEGKLVAVDRGRMKNELSEEAICFFPALPLRQIGLKDLLQFMVGAFRSRDLLHLLIVSLLISGVGLFAPYANKMIFDSVIPNGTKQDLLPIAALLIGTAISGVLFTLLRSWILQKLKFLVSVRVEPAVMARTFFLKAKFFMQYTSGELHARIMSIGQLCDVANDMLVSSALSALFSFIYLFQMTHYAPQLSLPALSVILGQFTLTLVMFYFQRRQEDKVVKSSTKLSGLLFDVLSGVQKIKTSGSEKRAFTRWMQTYSENARLAYNPPLILKLSGAWMGLLNLGGTALLYLTAVRSQITPSDFIAFNTAYGMVSGAFASLIGIVPQLGRLQPLLRQAQPIMEAEPENVECAKQVMQLSGAIEVNHLSFRYDEQTPWILKDLNLHIRPGEYVGVVGRSGCGKSTLLRLLLGFEMPQSGHVLYDDYELSEIDKSSLRRQIGTCLQSGNLFPGDVFSNITITAPWCSKEDAWEAARLAGIADDIKALPMGMNTLISEGGGGFSGGQKQRLLIARALVNRPAILFFDEATSALDNVSQKQVSENLDRMGCTRLIIAHRLSTIRHCDRIIVLDQGVIAEEGTFEELSAKGGIFTDLMKRQML